jgi:hypothetical protein
MLKDWNFKPVVSIHSCSNRGEYEKIARPVLRAKIKLRKRGEKK